MKTDIHLLGMKALLGLELTDEERLLVQRRNAKYELVRYLYREKMEAEKLGLKDFHFTPNEETFMEVPTIDIVNSLIEVYENMKDAVPLDFGDYSLKLAEEPLHTGRIKRTMVD